MVLRAHDLYELCSMRPNQNASVLPQLNGTLTIDHAAHFCGNRRFVTVLTTAITGLSPQPNSLSSDIPILQP